VKRAASAVHERIVGLYEEKASAFDRQRGRSLFEKAWLDRFASGLPKGGSILDIGCGMGEPIARYLIELGFRVTGIDASAPLIAMCKERFPEQEWLIADMRSLALGRRFDGLLAWHSSFHLHPDDQRPMFARFAAHARPKAMLMFTSGPEAGESVGEFEGEPLYSASLAPTEYRMLLGANGFSVVDHQADDEGCGGATVWLGRRTP
jgi:2-polyprenyl-3-methyl-5-hydroxy-6-metoxy-1,4-benzoquinol methylase